MCQRCVEQESDPRHGAFQPIPIIESVSIKDARKVQEGQTGYVVLTAFQDAGEAKFISFTMMQDPALEAVKLTGSVVCLN